MCSTFLHNLFYTGDLLYNVSDGLGWCYSAYCNASCKVETQSTPCPTYIPSTTAHSSSSLFSTTNAPITSSVPLTTTRAASTAIQVCYDGNVPKQVRHQYIFHKDKWFINNWLQNDLTVRTHKGNSTTIQKHPDLNQLG